MKKELFEKYNKRLPRYTSYPSYPFWSNDVDQSSWLMHLQQVFENHNTNCNVYIHIPYCEKLCFYCGCSRTITRNHRIEEEYLKTLFTHWDWYVQKFPDLKINGLYLGGGTPTFLSPHNMGILLQYFEKNFSEADEFRATIEVDPRVTTFDHLQVFVDHGVKRISLGIQDFSPDVQKKINRIQSFELVQNLVSEARKKGITEINCDLIYGLPDQNLIGVQETVEKVIALSPENISFYSYAHTPSKSKNQKALEKYHLPQNWEKRILFEKGKELFLKNGYLALGLDHFVKEGSSLYHAYKNRTLTRNFMGYDIGSTKVTIGLGASAISNSGLSFIQNPKDVPDYLNATMNPQLMITHSHTLNILEQKINEIIQDIMCYGRSEITSLLKISSQEVGQDILSQLNKLADVGFIKMISGILEVTHQGMPFLRNICEVFDYHMKNNTQKLFSQSV
ncbi:MAG: oxygen-independent coproporphyrinogen III oxidase [Halobacteriovoraceae bacterium]|nr:oxygen-independent coproporphyrinogen III oxidase [Halobacteriovoraceae bacterium]MCB9095417.1 oxygen-independent coproporphyrinogen III oxidase [Halobacteriovoraceae bacterium]